MILVQTSCLIISAIRDYTFWLSSFNSEIEISRRHYALITFPRANVFLSARFYQPPGPQKKTFVRHEKECILFFFFYRAKRKGSKLQLSRQLLVIFTYASKRCAAVSPSRFILNGCKSRELRSILLYTKQLPLQCSWFIFFLNDQT